MKELNELIKESGRTKVWLTKQLGIPYITLYSYLAGKFKMPKEVEEKIRELIK